MGRVGPGPEPDRDRPAEVAPDCSTRGCGVATGGVAPALHVRTGAPRPREDRHRAARVTVVRELGQKTGVPTPFTDALLGLARVHAQVHGLY